MGDRMGELWAGRLRFAVRIGIAPEAFWRLSLAEWRALTTGERPAALGRSELDALLVAHPDESVQWPAPHPGRLRRPVPPHFGGGRKDDDVRR